MRLRDLERLKVGDKVKIARRGKWWNPGEMNKFIGDSLVIDHEMCRTIRDYHYIGYNSSGGCPYCFSAECFDMLGENWLD